ncbi:flagellar basal body rod protein [Anoxybacteroides tepidamans]|uniref:lmo0954 family membrane protein n=1 Tax=Anoxybacteroides tepidamans TaxID=265948 RepID=UPI000488BEB3|nr:flagellar basal body rod protein [Anoxybacillus tepidamans]
MLKKIGLLIAGGIASIVLLANAGSLVGLAISLVILYYAFKKFLKAPSAVRKVMWAIVGLIALSVSAANMPAIAAIAAAYVLYVVYKKWNEPTETITKQEDPFANFEKQWNELQKNY